MVSFHSNRTLRQRPITTLLCWKNSRPGNSTVYEAGYLSGLSLAVKPWRGSCWWYSLCTGRQISTKEEKHGNSWRIGAPTIRRQGQVCRSSLVLYIFFWPPEVDVHREGGVLVVCFLISYSFQERASHSAQRHCLLVHSRFSEVDSQVITSLNKSLCEQGNLPPKLNSLALKPEALVRDSEEIDSLGQYWKVTFFWFA